MSDVDETKSRDAPNRELPQVSVLLKNAEFCERDRAFLTADALKCFSLNHPTPFYLYDGAGLQRTIKKMFESFSFLPESTFYLPVRLCAYRELIQFLDREGIAFLCETPEELELLCSCGVKGEHIRYSALVISQETAQKLREIDATIIIYSVMNLPSVMPHKVDFLCSDLTMAGVVISYSDLERSRLGLTIKEIARLIPLFCDIGAESFGLSFPTERVIKHDNTYIAKLETIYKAAKRIEKQSGVVLERFDIGNGFFVNYAEPDSLTNDANAADMLRSALGAIKEPINQTVFLCPSDRVLARFALFITSVIGMYRHHGTTVVVNASYDSIDDLTVRRRCHISIAGREWMDARTLLSIAGLRASDDDCFKFSATLRAPEVGDLIVFHDVGAAVPQGSPHAAYLYLANGSVLPLTR